MRFRREAKKVIICIILLFSVSFILLGANKELTIMSFNIACHARAERSNNNEAWVNQIVEIIKKSKAQIVLLQEVRLDRSSEELVRSFVKKLNKSGGSWNYATSVKYSISSSDLNNAVLYNSKYVALKEDLSMQLGFIDYKTNYDQNQQVDNRKYKFVKNNVQVLEFEIVGKTSKSFILVNVHLPDSDKKVDERRALESLYAYYKRKEAMAIIIGGDFNIRRKELKRGSNFSDEIIDGVSGPYSDVQGQKTTVSTVASSGIVLVNEIGRAHV